MLLSFSFLPSLLQGPRGSVRDVRLQGANPSTAAPAQIPESEGCSAQCKIPVVLHPVHQNPRFHGQKSILLLFIHEMPCFRGQELHKDGWRICQLRCLANPF